MPFSISSVKHAQNMFAKHNLTALGLEEGRCLHKGGQERLFAGTHPHRDSVLKDDAFGERYAYGMAEGAALNPLEPWRVAAAVGRDMGQFLLGSVGWKPAQANIENDDSHFQHSACKIMNAKLKVSDCHKCAEALKLKHQDH